MDQIIDVLKDVIESHVLPGAKAHSELSPITHQLRSENFNKETVRLSAVLILLYPFEDKWHSVFIQRPEYKGAHSRQIAFPGGKKEDIDSDLYQTALRESFEEIGVIPDYVNRIGALTEVYIPISNFMVYPFVAKVDRRPKFVLEEREVDGIVEFKIEELLQENIVQDSLIATGEGVTKYRVPSFIFNNRVVWGATAMMLNEFRHVLLKAQKLTSNKN